jgi:ribonuclease-3
MEEIIEGLEEFSKKIGVKFKNTDLLVNAFVHRSYLNENHQIKMESNERLEFLGDAVLELVVTEYLFAGYQKPEGELTAIRSALVRGKHLSEIADEIGLFAYILLSQGEKNGSEKSKSLIMANAFEALVGAIYLDQGYDVVKKFILDNVVSNTQEIINSKLYVDAKSEFQEKVQEKFKFTPHYKVLEESGPDHNKKFVSGVFIDKDLVSRGEGSSKNLAEQDAARIALEKVFS